METYDQYRLLLTSNRMFDIGASMLLSSVTGNLGMIAERKKPIIDIYSITEKRYKLAENHKIGLVGNAHNFTPDEDMYLGDLRTMLKNAKNPLEGIYQAYEFGAGTKPKLLDLVVTSSQVDRHNVQLVWKVTKIRTGLAAFFFDDYQLTEINGMQTMNLMDFVTKDNLKVEILKETSLKILQ